MAKERKTELYEQYHDKVYGFLLGKLNNVHEAEDLCSDVFVKVYEKLDTFDESKASLSTWIFTIMRNTLTDHYRLRRVSEELPEDLAEESSVEEEVCNREMLGALASALEKLEPKYRDVIILHYYSGIPLNKVADRMGLSYSYVKLLHTTALERLKTELG